MGVLTRVALRALERALERVPGLVRGVVPGGALVVVRGRARTVVGRIAVQVVAEHVRVALERVLT